MKTLLRCLLFVAFPSLGTAQNGPLTISADSLSQKFRLAGEWRYHDGDDTSWASPDHDDSRWSILSRSSILPRGKKKQPFSGTAWFRKRLIFDTSIVGKPVALMMSHDGASQIFLDGRLLKSNGVFGGDSTELYDPNDLPFVFVPSSAGEHLLAVRYSEPDAAVHWGKDRGSDGVSFKINLREANDAIYLSEENNMMTSVLLISLASIFGTIALLHFILYLYRRSVHSNGLFALFAFCLALCFLIAFLAGNASSYAVKTVSSLAVPYVIILSCLSLSGFINALFGQRKWRFRAIVGLGILAGILFPFAEAEALACIGLLGMVVLLEVVILVILAVRRRVPGARIIAVGILSFPAVMVGLIIFMIVLIAVASKNGHLETGDGVDMLLGIGLLWGVLSIPISMSVYLAWSYATVNKRLEAELLQVETLSEKSRQQEEEKQRFLETRQEELEREVAVRTEQLRGEKRKSDELLLNILPEEVADELKEKGHAQARLHNDVTVLFTDFVDFTRYSEKLSPGQIVEELDSCFKAFDEIITRHGLEKIKTIGDAYMAVAGLPLPHIDGAAATVTAALEIRECIRRRRAERPDSFDIRIGVHSGPVVAGIIGVEKFAYDVWGDTVNTAARMEQSSEAGRVNISGATYALVEDRFVCSYRGEVAAKGKGAMTMYFVESAHKTVLATPQ